MSNSTTSIENPAIWDIARFDGLMFTLFAVAALTTVLRLLTRGLFLHAIGADDVLAVAATFTGAALSGFEHQKNLNNNRYLQAVRNGEPIESGPIVLNHLTEVERMTLLNGLAYVITLCLIKCAILTFYRRVVVKKEHIYMIYATGAFIVTFTIAYVVAKCLSHDPPASVWNPYDPKYGGKVKCLCALLAVINSSFQTAFDIMILAIPFFIFRTLKLNHSLKVGIVFIYILGLFSFSTTLVRLSWAIRYINMKDFVLQHEKLIEFSAWTVVETYTALICANLPPMTTLLRRTFNKIASSAGLSTGSGSGPISAGEKHSGSGSGSGNSSNRKRKNYFRSLRHKRSGSEAQLARKAAPFGLSWSHVPSPTADSSSAGSPTVATVATAAAATEGSLSSPTHTRGPTASHQSGGRFHRLPFYHQQRQAQGRKTGSAPLPNGIEVETDVDVEKVDIVEVAGTGGATTAGTVVDDYGIATGVDGGGRASGSKDFGTRGGVDNHLLSSSTMRADSRPWGTITTVTGTKPGGNNNSSNSSNAKAYAHDYANTNTNIIGTAVGNVGHGHGHEYGHGREDSRSRTRTGGPGGPGGPGGTREIVKSATDERLTKSTSTNSYQVGLPIQRLESDV